MISNLNLEKLVNQYKNDSESVYNTWFIDNDTRLKAFRSIRRGAIDVINSIKNNSFGNLNLEFLIFMKIKKIRKYLDSS